ncbi:MAG: class I SAM-dependent methyltransferase [Candidatus Cloacimonetes bacterium]|nr:class I SAM-dependent methyltransferase [Candidatus Cloacimonadota bacterium]
MTLDLHFPTADAAILGARLLRFFQAPTGVTIRFYHPPHADWGFELDAPWLQLITESSPSPSSARVCNSLASEEMAPDSAILWCSGNHRFLFITSSTSPSLLNHEFLTGHIFWQLEAEADALQDWDLAHTFTDIPDALARLDRNSILISANQDLILSLIQNQPEDLWQFAITPQSLTLALNLEDTSQSNLRAYKQLQAFGEWQVQKHNLKELIGIHDLMRDSYSFFAEFYDRFMAHVDYSYWLDKIFTWHNRFASAPAQKVLELACGTANIAEQLVFRGMEVEACDYSPFMLYEAAKKCFCPTLFLASMDEPLPRQNHYDLILCLFDSINYLVKTSSFRACLRSVQDALKPGGIFIFDISTINNSRTYFADTSQHFRYTDAQLYHHAFFDELSLRQRSSLTLFRKRPCGWVSSEEQHAQRVYRHREIMALINDCDLELLAIFTLESRQNLLSKRMQNLDENRPRLYYLLRK